MGGHRVGECLPVERKRFREVVPVFCVERSRAHRVHHTRASRDAAHALGIPGASSESALAAGLELPPREVQDAAGEQFLGVATTELDASGKVRLLANRASSICRPLAC